MKMTRRHAALTAITLAAKASGQQMQRESGRPTVRLQSAQATAVFDLLGGSLVDFHLLESPGLNPFTWDSNSSGKPSLGPRSRGHFLCMDRWGQPSDAEKKNGMPFHGEASGVEWKAPAANSSGAHACQMEAMLPMAQLHIERHASLDGATLTVRERVTNRAKLGRMYNMVQHPSIAPPFLDEATLIDANFGAGFAQSAPDVRLDNVARFRTLKSDHNPNVVSFVIDEPLGWVTALSPTHSLAVGYVWKTSEYPWLNLWRHVQDGKPAARGLEFGTTGLHQPFPEMVKRGGRMLGRPLFAYIDAGETQERSYTAFLQKAPASAKGVSNVPAAGKAVFL